LIIKNNTGDTERTLVEPTFPDNSQAFTPLTFADYVTALQAQRICIGQDAMTGMPFNQYDWQVPFVRCDVAACTVDDSSALKYCEYQIFAVAPSSSSDTGGLERANRFINYLYQEYPAIAPSAPANTLPFTFPFVQLFNSSSDLENYVKSSSYGKGDNHKVAFAVVWNGNSPTQYSYDLRQNSTMFNVPSEDARPASITTPPTTQLVDSFANDDASCPIFDGAPFLGPRGDSCTGQYLYNGMITMHNLVGDFILYDSGASESLLYKVARAAIRFVPFPTRAYEEGGFFSDINGTYQVGDPTAFGK
jgi:hypothetical protein